MRNEKEKERRRGLFCQTQENTKKWWRTFGTPKRKMQQQNNAMMLLMSKFVNK